MPPLLYASCSNGSYGSFSKLIVGQTAFSYLYATNAGWYRIMQPLSLGGGMHISGTVTINTFYGESTELQVEVSLGLGSPSIFVTRAPTSSSSPVVDQARAFYYWDSTYGDWWGSLMYMSRILFQPTHRPRRLRASQSPTTSMELMLTTTANYS